jgi:hypothetical protein
MFPSKSLRLFIFIKYTICKSDDKLKQLNSQIEMRMKMIDIKF